MVKLKVQASGWRKLSCALAIVQFCPLWFTSLINNEYKRCVSRTPHIVSSTIRTFFFFFRKETSSFFGSAQVQIFLKPYPEKKKKNLNPNLFQI